MNDTQIDVLLEVEVHGTSSNLPSLKWFDDGAGIVVLNELALLVANSRDSLQTWNRTGTQGVKIGRCPLFRFVDVT